MPWHIKWSHAKSYLQPWLRFKGMESFLSIFSFRCRHLKIPLKRTASGCVKKSMILINFRKKKWYSPKLLIRYYKIHLGASYDELTVALKLILVLNSRTFKNSLIPTLCIILKWSNSILRRNSVIFFRDMTYFWHD